MIGIIYIQTSAIVGVDTEIGETKQYLHDRLHAKPLKI